MKDEAKLVFPQRGMSIEASNDLNLAFREHKRVSVELTGHLQEIEFGVGMKMVLSFPEVPRIKVEGSEWRKLL